MLFRSQEEIMVLKKSYQEAYGYNKKYIEQRINHIARRISTIEKYLNTDIDFLGVRKRIFNKNDISYFTLHMLLDELFSFIEKIMLPSDIRLMYDKLKYNYNILTHRKEFKFVEIMEVELEAQKILL